MYNQAGSTETHIFFWKNKFHKHAKNKDWFYMKIWLSQIGLAIQLCLHHRTFLNSLLSGFRRYHFYIRFLFSSVTLHLLAVSPVVFVCMPDRYEEAQYRGQFPWWHWLNSKACETCVGFFAPRILLQSSSHYRAFAGKRYSIQCVLWQPSGK